jgi:hypothetical protein
MLMKRPTNKKEARDSTTIRMNRPTLKRIRAIGTMGQSYDEVINMLIDSYTESKFADMRMGKK